MRKSLPDAARLAMVLSDLQSLSETLDYQAIEDARGAEVAADLKNAIGALGDVLRNLVDHELDQLPAAKIAMSSRTGTLQKAAPVGKTVQDARQLVKTANQTLGVIEEIKGVIEEIKGVIEEAKEGLDRIAKNAPPPSPFGTNQPAPDFATTIEALSPDERQTLMLKLAQSAARAVER